MIKTPSLNEIRARIKNSLETSLAPLKGIVWYDDILILGEITAGAFFQIYKNNEFIEKQIFPDTASGEFLDEHWAWRSVYRQGASFAEGKIKVTGAEGATIPEGIVFETVTGQKYVTQEKGIIQKGETLLQVRALSQGNEGNLPLDHKLTLTSPLLGIDEEAVSQGLSGGVPGESDYDFRRRILNKIRGGVRYGKPGDWIAWAIDSSPEVTKAWEFPLSDSHGTLLIQTLNGIKQVGNLPVVRKYIASQAPPSLWKAETPELIKYRITAHIVSSGEDTVQNREEARRALEGWFFSVMSPGRTIMPSEITGVLSSPRGITGITISGIPDKGLLHTIYQYPVLEDVIWN